MKTYSRNLTLGMQGSDVRELHRDLGWLGVQLAPDELLDGRFGNATRAAVLTFQKDNGLDPSAVVDLRTAAVLNTKLAGLKRVVRGNVRSADGKPLGNAIVRAVDQALRSDVQLGEAVSNADGYFEVTYAVRDAANVAPSLVLRAFAAPSDRAPSAWSDVIFEAPPELIVNLVVGPTGYRGPSEFERLMRDVRPVLAAQRLGVADLVEDEKSQEATFLSRQIGHAPDRVAHAVVAHRHAARSGVEPEIFYAFLRQGLPAEPSALLSQPRAALRRAVIDAVKNGAIPEGFKSDDTLKAALGRLDDWRIPVAMEEPLDPARLTLGRLVKGALPETPQQERFMRAYAAHTGPIGEFWTRLEQDVELGRHAAQLKLAVFAGTIGQNHAPLIDAVRTSGFGEIQGFDALQRGGLAHSSPGPPGGHAAGN